MRRIVKAKLLRTQMAGAAVRTKDIQADFEQVLVRTIFVAAGQDERIKTFGMPDAVISGKRVKGRAAQLARLKIETAGKPLSMTKEQLMDAMIKAIPAIDSMPKAPKGEAAGKKSARY